MGACAVHRLVITFHNDAGPDLEYASRAILGQGSIDFAFNGRARSREHCLGLHSCIRAGAAWEDDPPKAIYAGGPVIRVLDETRAAVAQALKGEKPQQAGSAK